MAAPSAQDAARRLLILLVVKSHALRLMMVWDFGFHTRQAIQNLTGKVPVWRAAGFRFAWMRLKARWNLLWERRAARSFLDHLGLSPYLSEEEKSLFGLGLSENSRTVANRMLWQIEAAACIAWALRLMPRIWPMDEQFQGNLDPASLAECGLVETAILRPAEEIQAAREHVYRWHWRARQFLLERDGVPWPPVEASLEAVEDLRAKGLDSFDAIVRFTARSLHEQGKLDAILDDDFVARGKAYRLLPDGEVSELCGIAAERHKALNWLCGMARNKDWAAVPVET